MSRNTKSRRSPLTAWLCTLDAEQLHRVLSNRPDAGAAPEPRALGELADRLQRPGSVAPAIRRLPLPCLQVAEALAALGETTSRSELAALLGVPGPQLDDTLAVLADHALVWADGDGRLHQAAALRQAWPAPLGLEPPLADLLPGQTSEDLRGMLSSLGLKPPATRQQRVTALLEQYGSAEWIAGIVAKAPTPTRELLERRARTKPVESRSWIVFGSPSPEVPAAARWAVARGLLVQDRHGFGPARMPAEVALALRGADWHAPFDPVPPLPALARVSAADVGRETASAAGDFGGHAAAVLAECAARPLTVLKSGGVGARELARVGKAVRCDEPTVRLVLETAQGSGLVTREGDRVLVTGAYDSWAEEEPAAQVAQLVGAWWQLPLTPTQSRDEDGKVLPALAHTRACDGCVQARRGLLAALGCLPPGQGVAETADLSLLIDWHHPFAEQLPQDERPFATVIHEASLLGVLARGALSPLGAALGNVAELADQARQLMPPAVHGVRIGSDLTAVATGAPSARLTALLDSLADREARGTASVWRFSADSLRRAFDAGHDAPAIEADLAAIAGGPLPQALSYLITDTARRHGRVRVASAACVIHGLEPALLAEIVAHRKLAGLGLRQLAPTVLVGKASVAQALAALRANGYAPVAEAADGAVRIERTAPQRATPVPRPRARAGRPGTPAPPDLRSLASKLVGAPAELPLPDPDRGIPYDSDTEEIFGESAKHLSLADVRQLAHAVHTGEAIIIEYVDGSGAHTVRSLSALELDPPYLNAWCHLRDDARVFALSRILGVMPT
ncbi:helicase-associated domain-containing protein [Kitasatospora aureofaciens]|uniref:helicase-associated domain-containing protein n=1 Tax=Kitasatospora aureofaciens TaxID=1894 RepID=UPI0038074703